MVFGPTQQAAVASQILFLGAGLVLLWLHVAGPAARARYAGPRLARWDIPGTAVLQFLLHALCGGFLASFVVGLMAPRVGIQGDALVIAATASLHTGALIGMAIACFHDRRLAPVSGTFGHALLTGAATFLMAMPFVYLVNLGWLTLLKALGVEVERQPAVEMVARLAGTPWLAVFIAFAVIVAPAAEEMLFRAGLYRYLRHRQKRAVAIALPALLFAAIHFHLPSYLPLAALGVIFSVAYERTGAIGTAIFAHGLFNLNNLLLLLLGADQ